MEPLKDHFLFHVKDHLVTGKTFPVYWDNEQRFAFTDPQHIDTDLDYYDSPEYDSHKKERNGLYDVLYDSAQKIMFSFKWRFLSQAKAATGDILDVGTGVGEFLSYLQTKGIAVKGVEQSQTARKVCTEKGMTVYADLSDLPSSDSFQAITLWHVLEHLPNPKEVLSQIKTLLAPDGILVIAVPNFSSHDAKHYQAQWAALDVPRHLWHFTPNGLIALLEKEGYELVKSAPMWFDAFYVSYLSEKQQGTRFPLLIGLFKGFCFNVLAGFTGHYSSKMYCFKKRQA